MGQNEPVRESGTRGEVQWGWIPAAVPEDAGDVRGPMLMQSLVRAAWEA